jgi:hypothetical protein
VVELEQLLHDNPHKKLLVRALELKHTTSFDSVVDLFLNEMLLTGRLSHPHHMVASADNPANLNNFVRSFVCSCRMWLDHAQSQRR